MGQKIRKVNTEKRKRVDQVDRKKNKKENGKTVGMGYMPPDKSIEGECYYS